MMGGVLGGQGIATPSAPIEVSHLARGDQGEFMSIHQTALVAYQPIHAGSTASYSTGGAIHESNDSQELPAPDAHASPATPSQMPTSTPTYATASDYFIRPATGRISQWLHYNNAIDIDDECYVHIRLRRLEP